MEDDPALHEALNTSAEAAIEAGVLPAHQRGDKARGYMLTAMEVAQRIGGDLNVCFAGLAERAGKRGWPSVTEVSLREHTRAVENLPMGPVEGG